MHFQHLHHVAGLDKPAATRNTQYCSLQGKVGVPAPPRKGEEDKVDKGRGGKTTSGQEFGKSQRAVENREKWRKLVAKSSVVPQRPSRLRD